MHTYLRALLLSFVTLFVVSPAVALDTSYYASSSQLASGHWVRVRVSGEGIFQITYQQLRDWGFDNPGAVYIYGYGGTALADNRFSTFVPDDVNPTPSLHTDDGRILFYGDGDVRAYFNGHVQDINECYTVHRNYYSTSGYYLVSDVVPTDRLPIDAPFVPSDEKPSDTHICVQLFEPEIQNPGKGGTTFHGPVLTPGQPVKIPFQISDFDNAATLGGVVSATMAVRMDNTWGTYEIPFSMSGNIDTILNDEISVYSNGNNTMLYMADTGSLLFGAYPGIPVRDGEYTVTITPPDNPKITYLAFDRALMAYPRFNRLGENSQLIMQIPHSQAGTNFVISEAKPTTHVWNISSPAKVYEHTGSFDLATSTFTATFDQSYDADSSLPGRLIAFDARVSHNDVEFAGYVSNRNIHADDTPDLVIITTDELYPFALQIADAHREHDGLDVHVYTQTQIFDEFSSATPSAMAYRRLAKMFYDRDPRKFRYLLLYGSTTWDNRGLVFPKNSERLLCYEVEPYVANGYAVRHSALNFCSDNYFGMLNDDFNPATMHFTSTDIAVGRIPVQSAAEALAVNPKFINYITTPSSMASYANVLLISDDGDNNRHLEQSQELARAMESIQPAFTFTRAHNSIYPRPDSNAEIARNIIRSNLLKGVGFFSYTGHGRPDYFTSERIWAQSYVTSTNNTTLPIAMLATCDTYLIDREGVGIAETMLMYPNGGSIASIAAGRSVYLDYNQYINLAVAKAYAEATGPTAIGDIYRKAYNSTLPLSLTSAADLALNILCYNLCGDPAIRINTPQRLVEVTNIMDIPINDKSSVFLPRPVKPLENLKMRGTVNMPDGSVDTSFNGPASITLYDAPHDVQTIRIGSDDVLSTITLDEAPLATTSVLVTDGKWDASFLVPFSSYFGNLNRIVITAESNDADPKHRLGAASRFDGAVVTRTTDQEYSGEPPVITELYIDSQDFADGDIVPDAVNIYGTIKLGDAGLNVSTAVGCAPKLILDGNRTITGASDAIHLSPDGYAHLSIPVSNLTEGQHSLTLDIADNAGARVSHSISFAVSSVIAEDAVIATEAPYARSQATFSVSHGLNPEDADIRIFITDHDGKTVRAIHGASSQYTWDLTDQAGHPVPDGAYRVHALVRAGRTYAASPRIPLTIIR